MIGEEITLVGHPFAPIGRGEDVRCSFRALRSVGVSPGLLDLYALNPPEPTAQDEFGDFLVSNTSRVNIFHINGDEVEPALAALGGRSGSTVAINVVYPAWELARYPEPWARQLDRFDEVWAPSRFIEAAVRGAVTKPVVRMPLSTEVILSSFLGRRWFGIPESAYAFLFFFDIRSYASRKNPEAVLSAFRRAVARRPYADCALVLKLHGGEAASVVAGELRQAVAEMRDRVVLIDRTMTDNEVKNLVRCCDCFVSLHRAEGFGRGLIEAMYLGKPVIGTAYSGNMDFMHADNSFLVDYRLVPVGEDQYPHGQAQLWAEPDEAQAADLIVGLLDSPGLGVRVGHRAALDIRTRFSYRAVGVKMLERIGQLAGDTSWAGTAAFAPAGSE